MDQKNSKTWENITGTREKKMINSNSDSSAKVQWIQKFTLLLYLISSLEIENYRMRERKLELNNFFIN